MTPIPTRPRRRALLAMLTLFGGLLMPGPPPPAAPGADTPAPALNPDPAVWLNGGPRRWEDLRGKVVLIDVWTFGCGNCYRSFPWLNALHARHADAAFEIVGIHAPEFAHEQARDAVAAKIREFGLRHPVMLDNDFAYWKALGNRFWPSLYLVDKRGVIRYRHVGETHEGDPRAQALEDVLTALLAEPD